MWESGTGCPAFPSKPIAIGGLVRLKKMISLFLAVLLACCGTLGASALEYPDPYRILYETNGGYIEYHESRNNF